MRGASRSTPPPSSPMPRPRSAVSGDLVDAGGAAFRSGGAWYGIRFRCRLRPDHAAVAAFAFKVGAPVPEEKWEAFNLPAEAGPASD